MKNLFFLIIFSLITNICFAQSVDLYNTGFDDVQEQNEWTQYRLGEESIGIYQWGFVNNELVHYYPVGGFEVTDDWMVSPEINFTFDAVLDSLRYKFAGFGYSPYNVDTLALYLINGSENPDSADTKILLHLFTDENFVNDNVWKTLSNIPIPAIPGESHLAFRYQTINNWIDFSIDDIYVSQEAVGIEETNALYDNIKIYPNPSIDIIKWEIPDDIPVNKIYLSNIEGKPVKHINAGETEFNVVELAPGLYYLNFISSDDTYSKPVFIE